MKFPILYLCVAGAALIAAAADIPPHMRGNFALAQGLLASKHESLALWPERLPSGATLRSPNAIKSAEDLKALLATAPKTFNSGFRFGAVVEFDGWYAAPLDPPDTAPGKSLWIFGVIVQKGSAELCPFSNW